MKQIEIVGLADAMDLSRSELVDRFPDMQKIYAGGAVADIVLWLLDAIPAELKPNDIDVFIPRIEPADMGYSALWDIPELADTFAPLSYIGDREKRAPRKIPFLGSAREGQTNWIELDTPFIILTDLLDSFDLNVTQAAWTPEMRDSVAVSDAFVDAIKSHTVALNPLVEIDERIRRRIRAKCSRYGFTVA